MVMECTYIVLHFCHFVREENSIDVIQTFIVDLFGMCRYFRSEESQESLLTIPVGNVTADTELTYEYGVRSRKKRKSEKSKGNLPQNRRKVIRVFDDDAHSFAQ